MPTIKLDQIKELKRSEYARGKLNPDYLAQLTDSARVASKWPFPPITLTRIPKKKKGDTTDLYKLVDGHHRLAVARALKHASIACEVVDVLTPEQLLLEQIKSNRAHGRRFDRRELTHVVKLMREQKKTLAAIAGVVGLSVATLSRILQGKVTTTPGGKRTGAGRPKGETTKKGETLKKEVREKGRLTSVPARFLEWTQDLLNFFFQHNTEIEKYMTEMMPKPKQIENAHALFAELAGERRT